MIKNAKLLALSLSSLLILTACGGGGGGGDDGGVAVNQPTTDGGFLHLKDNKLDTTQKYDEASSYDSSAVIVEGRRLEMVNRGLSDFAFAGIYANPQYVDKNGKRNDIYLYYQGSLTPESNMPKTGKINYQGGSAFDATNWNLAGAWVVDSDEVGKNLNSYDRATYAASVDLTADFDKKQLTGKVFHFAYPVNRAVMTESQNGKPFKEVPINATITGNKFAGTKNNVTTEGKFFGPNAESIAGTFNDKNQRLQGTFSADQVK